MLTSDTDVLYLLGSVKTISHTTRQKGPPHQNIGGPFVIRGDMNSKLCSIREFSITFSVKCTCGLMAHIGEHVDSNGKRTPGVSHELPECELFSNSDVTNYIITLRKSITNSNTN